MLARHLVAHTRRGNKSLVDMNEAPWLWDHLRSGFPDADALLLMPDHVHLVDPEGELARFRRISSGFTRSFGASFDILAPAELRSPEILARAMRYVFLNPVRAGIVADPWAWTWSTLRDLLGATHTCWTNPRTISGRTRIPPQDLLARLTTSADASFEIPRLRDMQVVSLLGARDAASATLRIPLMRPSRTGRPVVSSFNCSTRAVHLVPRRSPTRSAAAVAPFRG